MHLLPGGTELVTVVGMTGPAGSVQGFDAASFVAGLKEDGNPLSGPLPGPAAGDVSLGAVLLEIQGGKTRLLERLG